jgi:2-oxoglutarate dehydrogenase E2 component (dihydrolipoamide succinyltransferase)
MLYRGLRFAARAAPRLSLYNTSSALRQLPVQFQHVRTYADKVIKVPAMAESISEGTLKQWNKAVGDFVEQDEEIATIETDKVYMPLHRHCLHFGLHGVPPRARSMLL